MRTPKPRSRSYLDAARWVDHTLRGHAAKELLRIGFTPKQAQSFAHQADDRAIATLVLGELSLEDDSNRPQAESEPSRA